MESHSVSFARYLAEGVGANAGVDFVLIGSVLVFESVIFDCDTEVESPSDIRRQSP